METGKTGSENYASVNGLNMYHEVHGSPGTGTPLVMLHGALSATGSSFEKLLPGLAENRQVIAIEQQVHGHTADIDRPRPSRLSNRQPCSSSGIRILFAQSTQWRCSACSAVAWQGTCQVFPIRSLPCFPVPRTLRSYTVPAGWCQ